MNCGRTLDLPTGARILLAVEQRIVSTGGPQQFCPVDQKQFRHLNQRKDPVCTQEQIFLLWTRETVCGLSLVHKRMTKQAQRQCVPVIGKSLDQHPNIRFARTRRDQELFRQSNEKDHMIELLPFQRNVRLKRMSKNLETSLRTGSALDRLFLD